MGMSRSRFRPFAVSQIALSDSGTEHTVRYASDTTNSDAELVVLTPHCAGATPEAREAGLAMAAENIWAFLRGSPANVV